VDERLGVPLDADQERPVGVLDGLDRAVWGAGADPQAGAEPVDRLVVEGVDVEAVADLDLVVAQRRRQPAAGLDLDRVAGAGGGRRRGRR
jgi:hypothetical protein